MMTKRTKVLSLLLAVIMVISLMPTFALAADSTDDFYKIVHLDCGRKYFTKDWIKSLINEMAEVGYTQLQLAFGNDGLRFLLDDMSFTANGTTYAHDDVVSAVESGNALQNSSGDSRWLTQTEMDEIIAYADTMGIEIVPLMNLPGHANTILDIAGDSYNASGSNNTLDVANSDEAQAFGLAIFKKYVDYFAGKGCKFFNFGADEYANDASGTFSFGRLSSTQYAKFVSFINSLAAYIKEKGMTPRAFNDGLYYGNWTSVSIDTSIQCCYWSSGWSGYNVASASTIANKGHSMINTNGDFYYVLGKTDSWDNSGVSYASNWDNAKFMGTTFDSEQAGSMFCIWCDYPDAETEDAIYTNVATGGILSAMSEAMGHMPETPVEPEDATVTDAATGVEVTAPGLTSVAVTENDAVTSGNTVSKTYSITLNGGDYTDGATVKFPYDSAFDGCVSFSGMVGEDTFDVRREGDYFVASVPHFSEVTISGDTGTIKLTVGETYEYPISGANYANAVDRTDLDEDIATVEVTGTDATEATTTYTQASVTCNTLISSDSDSWKDVSGYYYTPDGTNYYPVYAKRSSSWSWSSWSYTYTYTWGYSTTSSTSNVSQIGTQETTSTSTTPNITVYTKSGTDGSPASTTITFTGTGEGTTYVKVGDVTYTIIVTAPETAETKNLNFGDTFTLPEDAENITITSGSAFVSVNGRTVTAGNTDGTATVTCVTKNAGGKVTARYTYTIIVTEINLSDITPLTVEFWITNSPVTDDNTGKTYVEISAAMDGIYSSNGVDITTIIPATTTKENRTIKYWHSTMLDTEKTNDSASQTELQSSGSGDDETMSGQMFTRVRYQNSGGWQVLVDDTWVSVNLGKVTVYDAAPVAGDSSGQIIGNVEVTKNQLVAYYLEILPVADELDVYAADWGKKGDGTTSGDYLVPGASCTVSVQVIYEDGTTNPATTTAADLASSTIAYGYWSSGRGIGTLNLIGLEGFQIWKVEAETGAMTYASSSSTWGSFTVSSFTWDNNPMTVYEGDPVDSYIIHNDSNNPSKTGYYENLMWDENNEAILIKVYVKAKPTEDSLTVHYMDRTANDYEFYSYNINVINNTTFHENFALVKGYTDIADALIYNTVKNSLGVTQTVTADLSKMSEIGAQYKYSDYTCVEVVRSEDGKDVYLYYTFNNTHFFVADYGLPIIITPADLGISGDWTSVSVTGEQYGTADATLGEGLTYTPTKVFTGVEILQLTLTDSTGSVTHQIYIYPATTVYYEDSFVTFNEVSDWEVAGTPADTIPTQALEALGSKTNVYGYDPAYASDDPENKVDCSTFSLGSAMKTTVTPTTVANPTWPTATFTFKGTGFDIISLTNSDSGAIFVTVTKKGENTPTKQLVVNNYYGYTYSDTNGWSVTTTGSDTLYQVPVMKVSGLAYAEYDVEIKVAYSELFDMAKDGSYSFWLDAIRIYDPAGSTLDSIYAQDGEAKPSYQRIKSIIVDANDYYNDGTEKEGAVFIDGISSGATVAQYENYGPNNETYLANNQAVAFKLIATAQPTDVQIGVKLALGTSATLSGSLTNTLTTATDMYYQVSGLSWTLQNGKYVSSAITIGNTTENTIVSLTNIKIIGAEFTSLSAVTDNTNGEALVAAFVDAQTVEEAIRLLNETPDVPVAPNPGDDVTVPSAPGEDEPEDDKPWENPYGDVDENAWYYEFIRTVSEKELMNGVENGFDPNGKLSRGMLVTILYRLNGSEKVEAEHKFEDVENNTWYTDAVAWAYANGIVNGYSETQFAPNKDISRQELAAIIARYAEKFGIELKAADGTVFADDAAIQEYARSAVYSLKASGILSGKGENMFDPLGTTTRAEAAKVIALLSAF